MTLHGAKLTDFLQSSSNLAILKSWCTAFSRASIRPGKSLTHLVAVPPEERAGT